MLMSLPGAGVLAEWQGNFMELQAANGSLRERFSALTDKGTGFCGFCCDGPVYVGVPSMAALCQHLSRTPGLTVSWGARVRPCQLQVPDRPIATCLGKLACSWLTARANCRDTIYRCWMRGNAANEACIRCAHA